MAAGANAVLLKSASAAAVVQAIRAAHQSRQALSTDLSAEPPAVGDDLTLRERDLLILMARGCSNQNICNALGIALPTVKYHVTHILTKLRADNRTEAVLVALRHQLVELQQAAPR
jgi:NarL family two-component system response regulator LiaR